MPIAAIYARVSSDKQREEGTIASQTAALIGFARSHGYQVPTEWVFEDEGYSGASLVRPGLEWYAILRQKVRSRRCWFMHPTG
jgi:site-specific DNA recombinase